MVVGCRRPWLRFGAIAALLARLGRVGNMSDISMTRAHELDSEQARANIEKLADKLAERLGGSWSWQGDTAICESRGVRARVEYDASSISIDVVLPRAFRPFRRRLESKIEESFERYFRRP